MLLHHIVQTLCVGDTIFVPLTVKGSAETCLDSLASEIWDYLKKNLTTETSAESLKAIPLCSGEAVAAERLHSDAEPGLFQPRRVWSKHHRHIQATSFIDLFTCSKTEGNDVILQMYSIFTVWDGPDHFHALRWGFGTLFDCFFVFSTKPFLSAKFSALFQAVWSFVLSSIHWMDQSFFIFL